MPATAEDSEAAREPEEHQQDEHQAPATADKEPAHPGAAAAGWRRRNVHVGCLHGVVSLSLPAPFGSSLFNLSTVGVGIDGTSGEFGATGIELSCNLMPSLGTGLIGGVDEGGRRRPRLWRARL